MDAPPPPPLKPVRGDPVDLDVAWCIESYAAGVIDAAELERRLHLILSGRRAEIVRVAPRDN